MEGATSRLVVNANMNVFLAFRENLGLLLALETRQLPDSLLNDTKSSLDLVLADDKRRRKADDVLMGGLGL